MPVPLPKAVVKLLPANANGVSSSSPGSVAVATNAQINNASGTPGQIKRLFEGTKDLLADTTLAWQSFLANMRPGDPAANTWLSEEMGTVGIWPINAR